MTVQIRARDRDWLGSLDQTGKVVLPLRHHVGEDLTGNYRFRAHRISEQRHIQ